MSTKAGFVAVVGRPNAGKSTLLNALLKERVAMVSHKANATRKRMNMIVMHGETQIVFVDTPGLHEREKELNQFMLAEALKAIGDCDLVVFLADARDPLEHYEHFLKKNGANRPHVLAISKTDMVTQEKLLKKLEQYNRFQDQFLDLVPLSATKNRNLDTLLDVIAKHLPESPFLYDPELLTTETIRDIYKELIREALFNGISDEIPYESDVLIEKIEEGTDLDRVQATIIVDKPTQKGIVIGKGGSALKRIGKSAREAMEQFSGKRIYLQLHVKQHRNWSQNKGMMEDLGYEVD